MISPQWGYFALVSYVPEPLGPRLDDLTRALPGIVFRKAHITILPPRPLQVPVEQASLYTRRVLDQFRAFEVELSAVRRFPVTSVVYLDVTEGSETVHRLHDALNSCELAFNEQFEFHPHLTLAGPVPNEAIDDLQLRAEHLWEAVEPKERFVVCEIVALWAEGGHETPTWHRLWSYPLRTDQSKTACVGTTGQTF